MHADGREGKGAWGAFVLAALALGVALGGWLRPWCGNGGGGGEGCHAGSPSSSSTAAAATNGNCLARPVTFRALKTNELLNIDGVLDEPVWQRAQTYQLEPGLDTVAAGKTVSESGTVRAAWDDTFFYLAVECTDSDVVAEGASDQMPHYKLGDVAELFLKPGDRPWYWEMYVTPPGKKTTYWFPGRGRKGLESCFSAEHGEKSGLRVAARVRGSLNDWSDRDGGWTAEMAVPVADLTARGEGFGPGSNWRILTGRYNYGVPLSDVELSMFPQLSKTNYHLHEEYAVLEFAPGTE